MQKPVRFFFQTLRRVLGPVMLVQEKLTQPKGLVRSASAQQTVDLRCQSYQLYQFRTCPFCIKVRQEMRRLSLPIEKRNAQFAGAARQALQAQGGQLKVPCLRITDAAGSSQWLYDSKAIVERLRADFEDGGNAPASANQSN